MSALPRQATPAPPSHQARQDQGRQNANTARHWTRNPLRRRFGYVTRRNSGSVSQCMGHGR